jgi:L-fuconolactonase
MAAISARIDAHQHFWRVARADYGWLEPHLVPLYRDFAPADLAPLRRAAGISASVLVQAAPTVAETRFLLDIARNDPSVAGVVGWVDLAAADAPRQVEALAADPKLKGLRPMLQDLPDPDWIATAPIEPGVAAMQGAGLRFDALVRTDHLPALLRFVERHPQLAVVVDHLAKPRADRADFARWRGGLEKLAAHPQVCCKLSGLVTEVGADWTVGGLRPWIDAALELFGPARLMWGSDWPVLLLAGDYPRWVAATEELLCDLPDPAQRAIWHDTARRFYGLSARSEEPVARIGPTITPKH